MKINEESDDEMSIFSSFLTFHGIQREYHSPFIIVFCGHVAEIFIFFLLYRQGPDEYRIFEADADTDIREQEGSKLCNYTIFQH